MRRLGVEVVRDAAGMPLYRLATADGSRRTLRHGSLPPESPVMGWWDL